jgi:hypothetical protein
MLTSYPVACPNENCDWTGSLLPSRVQGGSSAVIASRQRAWFQCPLCAKDWEVLIADDRVTILPAVENGA